MCNCFVQQNVLEPLHWLALRLGIVNVAAENFQQKPNNITEPIQTEDPNAAMKALAKIVGTILGCLLGLFSLLLVQVSIISVIFSI